jgi:hypothetical protein
VAERVAEVELGPQAARVPLIPRDDRRLDLTGALHHHAHRAQLQAQALAQVRFEEPEERRVRDDAVLDDFGQAGAALAKRQGAQEAEVVPDQAGLVEAPEEILRVRHVHAGLAADGGVHLREECGGQLHVGHAAPVDRGRESGQVAHDPAAEGEEDGEPHRGASRELGDEPLGGGERLRRLRFRHDQRAHRPAGAPQRPQEIAAVVLQDGAMRDDPPVAA